MYTAFMGPLFPQVERVKTVSLSYDLLVRVEQVDKFRCPSLPSP